jgi:hypothetical protein
MLSEVFIVVLLNAFAALINPQPAACGLLILSSNNNTQYLILIYNSNKTKPPISPSRVSSIPDPPVKTSYLESILNTKALFVTD